jgi:hypothetical protein
MNPLDPNDARSMWKRMVDSSVVTKDVPARSLAVGHPARVVKEL